MDPRVPAQNVFDQVDMATVVTDRYGNMVYWNGFAQRLFRFSRAIWTDSMLVGRSLMDLGIAKEDHPQAEELARYVLKGGIWEGTFCVYRGDGSKIFARVHAVPWRSPSGEIIGTAIFAREAMKRGNQREQDKFGLLDQIGKRLAGSLVLEATLRQVAEALVPQFADHCFIDLFNTDAVLVRHVSHHSEGWEPPPETWAKTGEPIEYPTDHYCAKAMSRQEPILIEELARSRIPAVSKEGTRLCREMGVQSIISAPLCARGVLHGVMTVAKSKLTDRGNPIYDGFDKDLMGTIATRIALAIDNALLFQEERRTAEAFQRELLPQKIPKVDGLSIACRYLPAAPLERLGQGIQTQVGGDWYDVIPLSAGRVGIVIGDVEGRGAHAAAIMGQLRAALRAFAQDDRSPSEILGKLDEWVRSLGEEEQDSYGVEHVRTPYVTCMYLVYDAWSRKLSVANAGHAAPLLLVDGHATTLMMDEKELGVPLGVGGHPFQEVTRDLSPGATLFLYTDGLIERRPRDVDEYISEDDALDILRKSVAAAADQDVETLADTAAEAVPGDIDDDMAILVLRSDRDELAVREWTFPADAVMVSEARRNAANTLTEWGMGDEHIDLACLLVSEVVTNAVLHASVTPSPRQEPGLDGVAGLFQDLWDVDLDDPAPAKAKEFRLRLRRGISSVWVEVFDQDLRLPRIRRAEADDEGGRGLYLVDQLARRWGSRPTREGKAVWFEVSL
ncbi:MAG: SpoIIE family protein phosphatase [Streptosporangiales bacterium]|nr:SpoIIE family protein phosphatase [Streptosporangiales bacterium]